MSTDKNDLISIGVVSNCCFKPVILDDICTQCKEHCVPIIEGQYCKECGGDLDISRECINCGTIDD